MIVKKAVIMGMPVSIKVIDAAVEESDIDDVFSFFRSIDNRFSTYKPESEISRINQGLLTEEQYSADMKKILDLCAETKQLTNGYFDIKNKGVIDPSGLVKGYAIHEGAKILTKKGFEHYFVEIAGDIQTNGLNESKAKWRVGIENPFDRTEVIKVVTLSGEGIATSGTYIRGNHIYDPIHQKIANDIVSITVIAENVYEADRFATAAFAMGEQGLAFIESRGLGGYMVLKTKETYATDSFAQYTGVNS